MTSTLLTYFVPILKYAGIVLGGASGIMALLVDFKIDGKITKWGRFALWGVVISFLISATMQTIEIYNAKQEQLAEIAKTQRLFRSIERGLYNLDPGNMSFDILAQADWNCPLLKSYEARVKRSLDAYNQNLMKLPSGCYPFPQVDTSGITTIVGFIIDPMSPLYPNKYTEKDVYMMIAEMDANISFYKYDSTKKIDSILKNERSLDFGTTKVLAQLSITFSDQSIRINAKGMRPLRENYDWHNKGDWESLLDMQKAIISFEPHSLESQDFTAQQLILYRALKFDIIAFHSNSRLFACNHLCTTKGSLPDYYFQMPADVPSRSLNIECRQP